MENNMAVQATYDARGDVLYLAVGPSRKDVRYRDDDTGILIRVASDGLTVGVTVEDFAYVWRDRTDELSRLASEALHADYALIRDCVRKSFSEAL